MEVNASKGLLKWKDAAMSSPTLVVVSGPPGSGKTTLAHEIARSLGCPAVCRDEIKEGMAHSTPGFEASTGDPLTQRTFTVFFEVLETLLRGGVTVVAEAAFQDKLWRPNLEPLAELAAIRVIRCTVDAAVAHERIVRRAADGPKRAAHADQDLLKAIANGERPLESWVPISLDIPTLAVDTTDGYQPRIEEIVSFAGRPAASDAG
ncbi:ATP-binding protein [Planotetraspora sp. A-T 1434]|uniref:AAA family ATPase n=1 Tax=Planotetraspora sp. A-T 1434 TaxID=2979219 RepID=UPI0021BFC793|nr:ATP-binding protein [Planotetraspora sp. A-T 1434]MCT9934891.1 ATP-binding protein [Planotetraspora sp. A-T 1434]